LDNSSVHHISDQYLQLQLKRIKGLNLQPIQNFYEPHQSLRI
jgi:hypothetical protein